MSENGTGASVPTPQDGIISSVKRAIPNRVKRVIKGRRKLLPLIGKMFSLIANFDRYELVEGPLTYNEDWLACGLNCDFISDERFARAYSQGKSTGSWGSDIRWRAYVACWAANKAKTLEGDFVECGVNRGGLALTVAHYVDLKALPKKFFLMDTFCGFSEKLVSEEEKALGCPLVGYYSECYDAVKNTFKDFRNVEIVRGIIPDTLPLVKSEKVAYLSIDMNCALPEIAAAEYFWDKLSSGAVVVLDDYGWGGYHAGQKREFDAFAAKRGVQVLSLPTGQGLLFKP